MYRKLVFPLLFLLLLFSPSRVYAYTSHSLKNEGTLVPSLAVVLENGTAATTEISANRTIANTTVSCVHILTPIVNPNFTDGTGTDTYNWTENSSTNIAVEWNGTNKNTRFYIEAEEVVEEATCYQDFDYSGTTTSADLTFNYTVDNWDSPKPDAVTMKVQLILPNTTVFDVWTHNPSDIEAWTWVSLNITDYINQRGTYRLILYLYVDTPGQPRLYSFRWDDVGIRIETKGMEHDYVLKAVSKKTYHQNISLTLYDNTDIDRLANCTIWFYNTASSVQIKIIDGLVVMSTGNWYNLTALGESRIALFTEESNSGTSNLYIKLEAVKGNSIIYENLIKVIIN